MAEIAYLEVSQAGVTPVYSAASAAGDTFINNERTLIQVVNADTTNTKTITIAKAVSSIQVDRSGAVPVANLSIAVPPSGRVNFVAPVGSYGAKPTMTYDSSSGLTLTVIRQPII